MTHDVKIIHHHAASHIMIWIQGCILWDSRSKKHTRAVLARVAEKWTCLLHPCAIQYPHYQRNTQHLLSSGSILKRSVYSIGCLTSTDCDYVFVMLCSGGCEDWSWSAHWAQFAAKVLKTFACWVPCVRSPKCHAKESQSSHHPYLCPLQTDLARNTRWNRNSKAPLAPALFWDSWLIDSSVYTPMLTWLGTIQIMYSLEKLWDAIAISSYFLAALTPSQRWVIRTRAFLWRWSGKTAQRGNSICWKKTNIVVHERCWKSQHNPWFISDTSQKHPRLGSWNHQSGLPLEVHVYQCQIEKWITVNFTAFCLPKILKFQTESVNSKSWKAAQ